MKIREIIKEDFSVYGDPDKEITGIAFDSREIKGGEMFAALKGENVDGHDFILDAIKRGASSVMYERNENREDELEIFRNRYPEIVWICVDDARDALAAISNNFYKRPSEDAVLIGITGTNGKTTTSYLIKSIIETHGAKVGLIGTIKYLIKDESYDATHTTPEAVHFQSLLRTMVESGCDYIVTEVSSHALSQRRVDYSRFRVAVFTNLTRDHLDFHKTMEDYFRAKERLFTELLADDGIAVINIDEPYGERIVNALKEKKKDNKRILTYGINNKSADIIACDIETAFNGVSFTLKIQNSKFKIESPLIGIVNVYNILAASGVALSLGIPAETVISAIRSIKTISGRFESIDLGQKFLAIVDYAHTEDALERLLITARQLLDVRQSKSSSSGGRLITVFGCGGNRDRGKRSVMGDIATDLSDFVILTSDNPRNEDPSRIIRDIEAGIKKDNYVVIHDRFMAINMAVEIAANNDIVIIAGKGHEEYQEVKGIRHHFSDRDVLENAIRRKTGKTISSNKYRAIETFR